MPSITLELPDDVVANLEESAALENRSLDNYLCNLIKHYCYGEVAFLPESVRNWQPPLKTTRTRISPRMVAMIFHESKGVCAYCNSSIQPYFGWEVDHIVPLSRGGTNNHDNLCAACISCNGSKGSRTAQEFRSSLVFKAERGGA